MYEKRLKMYDYPILRHELFNLVHDRARRKVDHPKTTKGNTDYSGKGSDVGSKDVSDSLAGAIANALEIDLSKETKRDSTFNDFIFINSELVNSGDSQDLVDRMIEKEIDDIIDSYSDGIIQSDLIGGI